jgi:uncharacterized protein YjbI with pentapeptide repeats
VFEECDFSGAKLNVSEHHATAFLRCLFRRTSLFGATLDGCKTIGSTFLDCEMRPLTVAGGDWSYVVLRGQRLSGIRLAGVKLAEADLTEADLSDADLRGCDLSHARTHHTILRGADLRGADLTGVDLRSLDLTDVTIDSTQALAVATAYGAVVG